MSSDRRPGMRDSECILRGCHSGGSKVGLCRVLSWVFGRTVGSVDEGQEGLRIRSGWRPCALKTHMNRLGACV